MASFACVCVVAVGDRLLKVNSIGVEGLSHEETVEILQSCPDDVTLLVSQPKERLFAGITLLHYVPGQKFFF